MNDPNGLVFHEGRYHLFFQHNPDALAPGRMSWGHASSADLLTWQEHPIAIHADDAEQIFSGSAVADLDNTSGFAGAGQTALVAIYTSVDAASGTQSQALAHSVDGGAHWTKYAGNPVLDRRSAHFRDPKVFRYGSAGDACWIMVAVEAEDRRLVFYRSDDLRSWTLLSTFGPAGAVGGVWECPDLFPLAVDDDPDDVRWVLLISVNPGGIAGGSGTQYVVGRFDGVRFTPDRPVPSDLADVDWLDFGRDCYAGVTFNGAPDRVLIAWMSNWDYGAAVPTAPWRGAMTVARRLSLVSRDGRAVLRADPVLLAGRPAAGTAELPAAARIELRMRPGHGGSVRLELVGNEGRAVIRCGDGRIALDRTSAGDFHPLFPSIESARIDDGDAALELTVVVDSCSIEVFADGGVRTLTDLVFLGEHRRLEVSAHGDAALERLSVSELGGAAGPELGAD